MICNAEYTRSLFDLLNKEKINYCLANIEEDKRVIDIFVHSEDNKKFIQLLKSHSYNEIDSSTKEYNFIYSLEPDIYWKSVNGFIIHSSCQMSCTSMSNLSKCKLPLDEKVQKSIWDNKIWDEATNCWRISNDDYFIFLLTDAVFNRRDFDNNVISKIKALEMDFSKESLVNKLKGIFFLYTPKLLEAICEERFNEILKEYRTFNNY